MPLAAICSRYEVLATLLQIPDSRFQVPLDSYISQRFTPALAVRPSIPYPPVHQALSLIVGGFDLEDDRLIGFMHLLYAKNALNEMLCNEGYELPL